MFNVCFETGRIHSMSGNKDKRDPMSYRGISLASTMYKLYTNILKNRVSQWADVNEVIVEEQNGFRKNRSTMNHLSSLTSIIDPRKRNGKSTVCAFIDFRKAFDSINRDILWRKLARSGYFPKCSSQ